MAFTFATQVRQAVIAGNVPRHDVDTVVTDKGDLADFGAFVLEIIEEEDPKRDLLARVSSVGDFSEFGTSRLDAIRQRKLFYRAASVSLDFPSIVDANNAALQLQDELNTLVTDYQLFLSEFGTVPAGEVLFFPQPDLGLLTPLIAEFDNTVALRIAQQEVVDDKVVECNDASNDVTEANTKVSTLQVSVDALNTALSALNTSSAALTATQTSNNTLSPEISGTLAEWATQRGGVPATEQAAMDAFLLDASGTLFDEYNTNWVAAQITLATNLSAIAAEIIALNTVIATQTADLGVAQSAVVTSQTTSDQCQTDLSDSQAVLAALILQEAVLLAEILALCPEFEPT